VFSEMPRLPLEQVCERSVNVEKLEGARPLVVFHSVKRFQNNGVGGFVTAQERWPGLRQRAKDTLIN